MPRLIYYLFDRFNGAQKQIAFMPETPEEQLLNSKTFVIGFGPSGVTVANKLKELGRPPTVIDLNPNAEKIAQDLGLPFILGDAQNYEVMQHAGFQQASMIIITVPSKTAAEKIIHLAKRIAPTAKILVRSHYSAHKRELESLGPYVVVVDEEAVANALAQASQQCL